MDVVKVGSESFGILLDIVKDVQKIIASGNSGIVGEGMELVDVLLQDADLRSHLSALISAIKA